MRILTILLLLSAPALSQPVLTITDARKSNPIATYAYFFEDSTNKLTLAQLIKMPPGAFQPIHRKGTIYYHSPPKTAWVRFAINNQTDIPLFLLTLQRTYEKLDVYVQDRTGQWTHQQAGNEQAITNRLAPTAHPIVPLGRHPRWVYIATAGGQQIIFTDLLRVSDIGYTILERKITGFWQGIVVGTYLLLLFYAVVFFIRLRYPILGWYALFLFTNLHWFLFRSGYVEELLGFDSSYFHYFRYYPIRYVFALSWAVFHIKFLHLKQQARPFYNLLVGWLGLDLINYLIAIPTAMAGKRFSPLELLLTQIGIDWAGKLIITLGLLLISLVYVSRKNIHQIRWYALAFFFGLTSMIISLLALYNISWLPYYPYNYLFVFGSVLEMIVIAYALAERANEHRRQQTRTQQQLIDQLQENLNQKNKLLQIRDEIARDLHDEVGATLTSIAISTKLVQKKVGPERTDITPILEQIQADSQDTIHTIRETVWALNSDNDEPQKLVDRMQATAFQLLANQDIDLTFESNLAANELLPFSMEQRRNLHFVFKESLHNIIKHAHATLVEVRIHRQADELLIRITDNGIGFAPLQTGDGNGVKNFQKRAAEAGFSVQVCSELDRGTTVEIQIPVRETTHIGELSSPNHPVTLIASSNAIVYDNPRPF